MLVFLFLGTTTFHKAFSEARRYIKYKNRESDITGNLNFGKLQVFHISAKKMLQVSNLGDFNLSDFDRAFLKF